MNPWVCCWKCCPARMQLPENVERLLADNAINLKTVHFSYHDKEVLRKINLHIAPGTVNALVGPSDSRKSTIAQLIASLWDIKYRTIELCVVAWTFRYIHWQCVQMHRPLACR